MRHGYSGRRSRAPEWLLYWSNAAVIGTLARRVVGIGISSSSLLDSGESQP